METGQEDSETESASKFGRTAQNTSESGETAKLMAKASSSIQTETTMRETGATTRLVGMGSIFTRTETSMKEIGKMMYSMGMARNAGQMVHPIRGLTSKEPSMELGCTNGAMEASTTAIGTTT